MSAGIPLIGGAFSAGAIDDETSATAEALLRDQHLQEKNAEIAREAGQYNAARQQDSANMSYGATSADVAASGITQDSGSVLDILRQSHQNAELDRLNILHGAELQAIDASNRAESLSKQRESVFSSNNNRKTAALFGAASQSISRLPDGEGASQSSPKLRSTRGGNDYRTYNNSSYEDA